MVPARGFDDLLGDCESGTLLTGYDDGPRQVSMGESGVPGFRLPEAGGDKPAKKKFAQYAIVYFHVVIAEVHTE